MNTMCTLRPKNESIISWLLRYGMRLSTAPNTHADAYWVTVCLYKSQHGPLARVCYSQLELHNAKADTNKFNTCAWFKVPRADVVPFMHGQVIK